MMTRVEIAERVARELGAGRIVSAAREIERYEVRGGMPAVIVRPESAKEVAQVVRFAAREKLRVLPVGSGTKVGSGGIAGGCDVALDMRGLREVAHYDAGDLTVSVGAGLRLQELQEVLGRHGQFLPLSVPFSEETTIGGTVVSGVDSLLRMKYGRARDFLIGAEFVDGTGGECKSGGRVVKNVTGYDLHKLLIGSWGTLCAVTRLNFRTFPLPEVRGDCVVRFGALEAALGYRAELEGSGLPLSTVELLSPEMVALVGAACSLEGRDFVERGGEREWMVYAGYDGSLQVTQRIGRELHERAAGHAGAEVEILEEAEGSAFRYAMQELVRLTAKCGEVRFVARVSVPSIRCAGISKIEAALAVAGLECACAAHTAGILHVAAVGRGTEGTGSRGLDDAANSLFTAVAELGGHASLIAGANGVRAVFERSNRGEQELQRRLKLAFDPDGVFPSSSFAKATHP